jgi:hypothetical protein
MNLLQTRRRICAAAMLLTAQTCIATACGFDSGISSNTFTPVHPKSMTVAFAISDAVGEGALRREAAAPIVPGQEGYWRAVGHLRALQTRLPGDAALPLSVVFIDSNLWGRLTPGPQGYVLEPHAEGARDGDVVVVTSEGVLAAILDGDIPMTAALTRGLVVVDGEAAASAATRTLLTESFAVRDAHANKVVPVRLFGPAH